MNAQPRFGSRRGNAMIEFALSATVLTFVFTGVFQFGYSMYLYNELVGAVRAGARYASLADFESNGTPTIPSAYAAAVRNTVVYGTTTAGSTPVIPGLTTGQVNLSITWEGNVPADVTVSISSYSIDAVFKTYTVTGKPSSKVPFFGRFCPTGSCS